MIQGYPEVPRWCDATDALRALDAFYAHAWPWIWFSAFCVFWIYVIKGGPRRGR